MTLVNVIIFLKKKYYKPAYSVINIFLGSVGATNMNEHSSRSHAIFTITIERSEKGQDGQQHVRMGKLHMVDLAVSNSYLTYCTTQIQCFAICNVISNHPYLSSVPG